MEILERKIMSEQITAQHCELNHKFNFTGTIDDKNNLVRIDGSIMSDNPNVLSNGNFEYNEDRFSVTGNLDGLSKMEATSIIMKQIVALKNEVANPTPKEEIV